MTTKERKNVIVVCTVENSLNFELAKLKHKIQANCSNTSKTNLYIFTKEQFAIA